MHILLTDVVTCPRCGPEFGLIVLADAIEDRHIRSGKLGCANCREQFPIEGGVADLHWPREVHGEGGQGGAGAIPSADPERPYRMAALLGITGPSGPVAVLTGDAALVESVQAHLPHVVVVGVSDGSPSGGGEVGGGWVSTRELLPFRNRSLGGVVICSLDPDREVGEALRCLAPGGRLVVDPATSHTSATILREGADLLLDQDAVAVASNSRGG